MTEFLFFDHLVYVVKSIQYDNHHAGDGYILELHRIPPRNNGFGLHNGTNNGKPEGRGRPVFLQHGVFGSSASWLINPSHRSLGPYTFHCRSLI